MTIIMQHVKSPHIGFNFVQFNFKLEIQGNTPSLNLGLFILLEQTIFFNFYIIYIYVFALRRYIRYVRTCTVNNATYFTANVWAEMRNGTAYKVDIKVNRDGVIEETQCECGAGQGPTCHCKHVATLYYGLTQFSESGEIVTELTCTQVSLVYLLIHL